nr:type II secretion system protein [Lentisphaera araneosa]
MKKKHVSLIEILVVVAIIGILASLLLPSLKSARESAKSVNCLNNLRNLGMFTEMHLGDNDGNIPPRLLWYSDDYTGEVNNQSYRWHTFLGEYISSPGTNLFDAKVFSCPSKSIFVRQDNGLATDGALTYWVNNHEAADGRSPWNNNWGVTDPGVGNDIQEEYVNITEILEPATLASIYDVAQDWVGRVAESGAGGFVSHAQDIWDQASPGPSSSSEPETLIGYKQIPSQNGIHYWRGAVDFRHPRQTINTVNFDGSATRLINGGVKNKNMVNQ